MRKALRWLAKIAALVALAAIALVGILLLVMWIEHDAEITLPAPTGPFAVGRTTFNWTNDAVTDELAPSPSKRQVLVWMWYPAAASAADAQTEYLPAPWRAALEERQAMFMRTFFKR